MCSLENIALSLCLIYQKYSWNCPLSAFSPSAELLPRMECPQEFFFRDRFSSASLGCIKSSTFSVYSRLGEQKSHKQVGQITCMRYACHGFLLFTALFLSFSCMLKTICHFVLPLFNNNSRNIFVALYAMTMLSVACLHAFYITIFKCLLVLPI